MNRLLTAAVLATCAATALPSAQAAVRPPKPVCNIITDPSGDAGVSPVTTGPKAPGSSNEDIVSGDVSSDGRTITAVLRLAGLAQPDPQAPLGQGFFMEFGVKGAANLLFLSARTYPNGTQYVFGYSGADPNTGINTSYTIGTATGAIDTAKKEVRISVANAAFAPAGSKLPKGVKITSPTAKTYRILGQSAVPSQSVGGTRVPVGGLLLTIDDAIGLNYTVGVGSCVKPGS